MPGVRVDVKCSRVRYVTASFIGNHCNVIADLVLIRITEERIERVAHRNIGRPRIASVRAIRIEELRVGVVRGVARVQPNGINASIGRD